MVLRIIIAAIILSYTAHGSVKDTSTIKSQAVEVSQLHSIPFGSSGNSIDLSIENVSSYTTENIKVKVIQPPAWIKFRTEEQSINSIESNTEKTITYTFSVDKEAPVGTKQTLNFNITTPNGEIWNKQITISVEPPEKFELYQNYPNPFNPVTAIEYQLSSAGHVSLKVYNTLGQEVIKLVDEIQEAGFRSVQFDASNLSSGVYFYRLITNSYISTKKMAVTK
jgi:hypothetical protein